jgi:hypothetical protein
VQYEYGGTLTMLPLHESAVAVGATSSSSPTCHFELGATLTVADFEVEELDELELEEG